MCAVNTRWVCVRITQLHNWEGSEKKNWKIPAWTKAFSMDVLPDLKVQWQTTKSNQMARKAEFKVLPETSGREKWPNSKWTEVLNRIFMEEGVRMSPNYCQVPLPPHTASPAEPSVFISQAGNTGKGDERRGQMHWGRWASTTGCVCVEGGVFTGDLWLVRAFKSPRIYFTGMQMRAQPFK